VRIAHLSPSYWPEVTRGTERFVHDLSTLLAARGHDVTVLTTHPGPTSVAVEDGVTVVRRRRPPAPRALRAYEHFIATAPGSLRRILGGRFDVVHAHFPTDAWAGVEARRLGGPPLVLTLHGIPTRRYLVSRRYRLEMLGRAVAGADACTVWSRAAARPFRAYLGREPEVIPPGLFADRFAATEARADLPTIVCAASLGDPRKRPELLAAAFGLLRRRRPEARLVVVRSRDPHLGGDGAPALDGARWIDCESLPESLGPLYASAWASVLPAVEEAFGLVLAESLAAGTPVVADRSGAGPEIVDGAEVGRLFERDDAADLARAIDEALDLGADPGSRERCRVRARAYDWPPLVERWERLYERVASRRARSRTVPAASSPVPA
jgi:glycosyltransferase involved in cell wall biosynthesis